MFSYQKIYDDTIQTLMKLPHLGIDSLIADLNNNKITLYDFFTHIVTDEKIATCIKITNEAFDKDEVTLMLLYQTEMGLQKLIDLKKSFLSKTSEEKSEQPLPRNDIDLLHVLAPPSMKRIYPHNRYYDIFYDTKDMHHTKHYQPTFINFTKTTSDMMDEMTRLTQHRPQVFSFYLLANIHQYIDMYSFSKRNSYLYSIFNTFKGNRFNATAEFYAAKALLQMIIRLGDPKFKKLVENSDYENAEIFRDKLMASTQVDLLDEKNLNNETQKSLFKYIHKKEEKYTGLLLNTRLHDDLVLKLILKLSTLHYAKEKILKGEPAKQIIQDIKSSFKNVFKHRYKQKSTLERKIEKLNYSMFQKPIVQEEKTSQSTKKLSV